MSIDWKIDREIAWDQKENGGRILKGVMGVVLRHQPHEASWTSEEYAEIADLLGNKAEARLVEWRDRAAEQVATLSEDERQRLAWPGSDVITDINQFRETKLGHAPEQ